MKSGAFVEWWCDDSDQCLLVRVRAADGGPMVRFHRRRMEQSVADRAREGDRSPGQLPEVPLADLHRRGAFGPVACKHRVLVSLSSAELQADYDQGKAEGRTIKRFLSG